MYLFNKTFVRIFIQIRRHVIEFVWQTFKCALINNHYIKIHICKGANWTLPHMWRTTLHPQIALFATVMCSTSKTDSGHHTNTMVIYIGNTCYHRITENIGLLYRHFGLVFRLFVVDKRLHRSSLLKTAMRIVNSSANMDVCLCWAKNRLCFLCVSLRCILT